MLAIIHTQTHDHDQHHPHPNKNSNKNIYPLVICYIAMENMVH